jgi:hypothetical protein
MGIVYLVKPAELVGTSRYNLGTHYLCIIKSDDM